MPFAFTEQGVYMLMTVLKGDLAVRQSKDLIRTFKKMKDYILDNRELIGQREYIQLSMQTAENVRDISKLKSDMGSVEKQMCDVMDQLEDVVTKSDLAEMMNSFVDNEDNGWLMFNTKYCTADLAYSEVYVQAKKTIFVVDNYIGLRTLVLLKNAPTSVAITLFSDNVGNRLHSIEYNDFCSEYPPINITLKKTGGYIMTDLLCLIMAQKMKAFCDFNDYEIAGEYEVSFVLVFKLSRFGRNAADVLASLQVMQDFGVNLICVEDGIDSSKDAGKLMISVLSAVAEIERENIRIQTMEGRIQKAGERKWNGGFAPYGYKLVGGKLEINEEEAEAIRVIFDQYVNTDIGSNGIAKYLENHGIQKIQRQNGKNPLFDAALIRRIIQNPVYCGKIAYGRRKTEKVHGTRSDYHLVAQDNYLLVDGIHEAIRVSRAEKMAQDTEIIFIMAVSTAT